MMEIFWTMLATRRAQAIAEERWIFLRGLAERDI
jgi:hypothetical protein